MLGETAVCENNTRGSTCGGELSTRSAASSGTFRDCGKLAVSLPNASLNLARLSQVRFGSNCSLSDLSALVRKRRSSRSLKPACSNVS